MKKSEFISAENLKLMLIAIVIAALILLIPFYIKADDGCKIENKAIKDTSSTSFINGIIPDKPGNTTIK